ncbi:LOW QUALITY PROTEIN: uncharacterized protein RDI95_005101 [Morus bassanus]
MGRRAGGGATASRRASRGAARSEPEAARWGRAESGRAARGKARREERGDSGDSRPAPVGGGPSGQLLPGFAMAERGGRRGRRERALLWCVLVAAWEAAWGQLRYSVPEEVPKGSFVGDVAKDLGLELPALRHRGVRVVSGGRTQYFALHGKTGHLVTAERIDREQLCESVRQCVLRCEVIVEGEMQVYGIEVEITDINDNAPSFREAETELRLSEMTAPGLRFPLAEAHDPDVGPNALQRYELSGDEHFSLAVQAGPGGDQRPELVLAKALDREEAAFHELVLRASDGGEPARTGTARLRVAVLDANDNAPAFSQAEYTVRVPEDVPVGSALVTLAATDADEGINGHVKYSFHKVSDRAPEIFDLDSETGEILVKDSLDFEEISSHELEVEARDGGGLFDTAKVAKVTDVNDNAPQISVRSALSAISEDAPSGTVVALLHVQDRDSGANGEVRCSIDEGLPFRLEKSFEDYYRVVTARELDREEVSEYNVTVRAADGGSPALWSSAVLALRVLDVNDNAPVFAEARYSARLPENNAAGALVLTVRAADADWGQNARVRYRLSEGRVRGAPLSSYVSVQAETGALYALRSFDYEEVREVGLWVRAEDGGAPSLSSNVSVRLVIVDENDNAPQVLYPPQAPAPGAGWAGVELAPRSAEPGALVAKVVAVDADAGQNAWLSYELAKATEPGLFRVGLHSGEVRTARAVAERDAPRQRLVVLVRDRGQPPRSATATLGIALVDGFSDAFLQLSHAPAGRQQQQPQAAEEDLLTTYLVASLGCVSSLFLLSVLAFSAAKLGKARLRERLSTPSARCHADGDFAGDAVDVAGTGTVSPAYRYEAPLTTGSWRREVQFLGPVLPSPQSSAEAGAGKDEEPLCSSQPAGEREAKPGGAAAPPVQPPEWPAGRTARAIRETEAVRRPDMAIARQVLCLSAFLCLPHARSEPIRYSVAEEAESGSVVANVAADAGLAPAQLADRRARLASEDGRQHFRLDRGTGRLVVAERLDREELCGQSRTCTLPLELLLAHPLQFFRVEVAVEDINDHSPVFPEERVTFRIPERSDPGSRFPLEGARDLDVGSNSIQAYSIAPENEYFSVSFGSRSKAKKYVELVLEKPLDREEQAEVGFSLIAIDGGSPPRTGTTQIHIVVLDVNDNAPVFTEELYVGQILENAPEGSVVLSVAATDRDEGVNGDISYQFSQAVGQSDSAFTIDPTSGEIKLTKPLDFEAAENHELSVRATDGGGLSAICKVLVEVVDVNDNAPELVVSSFSSPLPENASPGTVVALFTVRDRDAGANGKITCALEDQLSFSLRPAYKNYYELMTVSTLDREETARYILTVTAADAGSPPLTTTQTFTVDISDVNDNAPVFNQTSYTMFVRENNVPAVLVGAVSATDADVGPNAKVTYSLAPAHPAEQPPCSCISVNSENGHVFVLRPLDYEQVRQIEVLVSASDAGSPPLSANVTIRLVVVDENDNAPLVLHPAQESSPPSSELVPVSAEAGYLITKVVAIDADSGQNSWLSYHLLRATDPGLFAVGAQSGEVRLRRPVTERDAVKQKLVVLVRDNGQPPLSATAALSALLLNDFSDMRLPHSSLATEDESGSLTTYLIISLVFVTLLFLASVAAFVTRKLCKRKELKGGHVLYGAGNLQSGLADAAAAGTLPHAYCYEISLTTGSGNSEFKFLKPILPSLPPQHCGTGGGADDEQDYPRGHLTVDTAPDNLGALSAEPFNSLSFN